MEDYGDSSKHNNYPSYVIFCKLCPTDKHHINNLKLNLYIRHGLQFTAQRIQKLRGLKTQKKAPQMAHTRAT